MRDTPEFAVTMTIVVDAVCACDAVESMLDTVGRVGDPVSGRTSVHLLDEAEEHACA